MGEIPADVLENGGCEHPECGYLSPEAFAKKVAEGTLRAESVVRKVVKRKKVGNKRLFFGEDYWNQIHKRVMFFCKGTAGQYRIDDDTRMSGRMPVKADQLPLHMYKFGTWLQDEMAHIEYASGNVVKALEVGTGAHYIATDILHQYDEGNGRAARAALNGILLWPSEELPYQKLDEIVFPVPNLRREINDEQLKIDIEAGKEIAMDPYIGSIVRSRESGTINPLELYIATNWHRTLKDYEKITRMAYDPRNSTDTYIYASISKRLHTLEEWIERQEAGRMYDHPIPDYLALKHVRRLGIVRRSA